MQMLVIPVQAGIRSLLTKIILPVRQSRPGECFSKKLPDPSINSGEEEK